MKLSTALMEIYEDPKKFNKDWETDKIIRIGKRGYLNIASNHPLLWKEIEKVKHLTRILNISRKNLETFKEEIKNQKPIEELTKGIIKDPINIEYEKDETPSYKDTSPTIQRLKKNYTYSKSEFKKMSIDAFKLEPTQNVLKNWEASNKMDIPKKADEVLENIKMQNPKLL